MGTTLRLDLSGFEKLMEKLDRLGGDLKGVTEDALGQAAETIEWDTVDAVQKPNLPRVGKYSNGDTEASIVRDAKVEWEGMTGSIGVGFDFGKPGAGGFLISGRGTPRIAPVGALVEIYKRKRYMSQIQKDMQEIVSDAIKERMEG